MSSKVEEYLQYTNQLGLTENEGKDLIGAIQLIAESILNKKYMLDVEHDNEE